MKSQLEKLGLICLMVVVSGCAQVGNFLVTPHPHSMQKIEDVKLEVKQHGKAPAIAPAIATGIVLAGEQLLKKEAEKYSASYSASNKFGDFQQLKEINFNNGAISGINVKSELTDQGKVGTNMFASTMKITHVNVNGFKSKVPCWTWIAMLKGDGANIWTNQSGMQRAYNIFGLINPLMILHAIYGLIDDDTYKVQVAVKMKMDAVTPNLLQPTLTNVADLTFDLGKISIFHLNDKVKKSESGIFAIPVPGAISTPPITQTTLPGNITVTVVEADDFGDLIGKAAKNVGDKKDSIADDLKKVMGIK